MFRRVRLSVRPNVRPGGRGSAAGPEPQGSPGPAVAAASDESGAGAATEALPAAPGAERDEKTDSSNDAGEASKAAEMPTQRRKRISTLPNLAKPRAGPSSAQRSSSKPQRRVVSQALDGSASLQKDSSPSEKTNVESSPKSPILPEKKTPMPQFSPLKKSASKEANEGVAAQKNDDTLQKNVPSPLKERPTQERSVTQEEKLPTKPTSVKGRQMCSDSERILKARKLREMLKEELKKERLLKHRPPVVEGHSPPDRSKMTMRDLIYYLPENNPMKSSLAEEKRTEKNTAVGQMKEQEEKNTPDREEEDEEKEAENGEENQDGPLLVPRVKVAEDGSIILDEESLTVEVLRTKGPCVVEENDPVFERGSTTTYSSFRKSFYTKPWSNKETDMFFLAISMVGTDFSLIGQLFPHRARAEIKNKFKREEKANGWRIDKAFKEKRPFDCEFFAQLLEKVLADEEKKKQKTVKNQKLKEKRQSKTQKKPKEKAASSETASDQDNSQKDRISDVETEADAVMAEKENEESLGVSEQTEEQATLEPASAKKKRKRRRKDDPEQEVESLSEESSAKIAIESKSSKKRESSVCDTNGHGPTILGGLDSVTEEKQDQTPVVEEERSESCLPVDDITKSDLNLYRIFSFQDGSDSVLEEESAKLRILDTRDEVLQASQLSKFPLPKIKNKERQSEETVEAENKDVYDSCKPDEKENASDGDVQPEIMETEKPALKGHFQRPKPNLAQSSGRREAATQEKVETENSFAKLVNEVEKCTLEDSRNNRNNITEVENIDLGTKSKEPEKIVISKTVVRGCRQRFRPNITRAPGKKEEPGKDSEKDQISHPETCNESVGLQEGSKQTVLKPALLKRNRMPRPKPNIGRIAARHEVQTQKKDPEEEKTECVEVEKGVTHPRSEKNDSYLKDDGVDSEDAQPCIVMLEDDGSAEKMDTIYASQCSPRKSSEAESWECQKESSAVLNDASVSNTEKSDPQKQEEKSPVSSARLLRSRCQRPKPNLGKITARKDVLDVNKGVSQTDTHQEESVRQCDNESSTLPDDESEVIVQEADALNAEEQAQQEEPQAPHSSGNALCKQSRSSDKLSSGKKSKSSDTKPVHQVRDPLWKPRSNLIIFTRKRDHSEEAESRNGDDTKMRSAGECLMSEKTDLSMQNSSSLVEAASCSEASRECHFTDSEETSCKRIRQESKFQSPEISSESESQEDDSHPSASQEKMSRRQSRRSSKQIASKRIVELRTASSSVSECEPDHSEKGSQKQKVKLNTKGKSLKAAHRNKSDKEHRNSKTTLVTLQASQEEEDEADDFEPDDYQCFVPEEVNKAPVFVRSPKPVSVQIEETMEELEISANVPDVQVLTDVESLSHMFVQPVMQREENVNTSQAVRTSLCLTSELLLNYVASISENPEEEKGINDGSTEAAMTLLAMGDPTFQLKINTEERMQMLPAQDDLHVTANLVNCVYSEHSVVSCQHLVSSATSNIDLSPSEDGSNMNLEHQITGTRTGGKEYFEKNATETSDNSVPMVSSIRPTSDRLLMPEPDFGVLRSNENIIQNLLNTNVLVGELEQIREAIVLKDTTETQEVELEQIRPASGDSLDLHDFATKSTQPVKQIDITERTEKETRNTCGSFGELQALTASPKLWTSEVGQELYPNQSSVDGLPEHNLTTAEHSLRTVDLTRNKECIQDFQQQHTSSTEETSVVDDNHSRCPEEEQTFILTLVEIPADSREYDDASTLLEQTSEPLLPAPILISPVSASGTSMAGVESIGSLTTTVDELAASLDSKMETKQLQNAPGEPIPKLVQTAQKRLAAELEEDDFLPAKKTLSTSAEDDWESTSKVILTVSILNRDGQKPLGFLSLICKKSSSESAEDAKGNRGKVQKPRIVTPKRSLRKPTVSSEAGRESCSLPSTSTSSPVECENMAADAAVEIPVNKQPEKPSLQAKDQEKEEAPTRISEYFFGDIFMEVDDSE
ncbi:uncharacterized protein ACNFOS_013626 [Eudromia elegans]